MTRYRIKKTDQDVWYLRVWYLRTETDNPFPVFYWTAKEELGKVYATMKQAKEAARNVPDAKIVKARDKR